MFVGGFDVSGDEGVGNYKYLAVVLGDEKLIRSKIRRLGYGDTFHMSAIRNRRDKMNVLYNVSFDSDKIKAFCITIERKQILDSIRRTQSRRANRRPPGLLLYHYNRVLFGFLRPRILNYLQLHGYMMSDITFQCDSDCSKFAKDNSLKTTHPDSAHSVADIVGWGNHCEMPPEGVVELNFVSDVHARLRKSFRR